MLARSIPGNCGGIWWNAHVLRGVPLCLRWSNTNLCGIKSSAFWWSQLHESWHIVTSICARIASFSKELLRRRQQGLYASTRRLSQEWRFHLQTHWSLVSKEAHRNLTRHIPKVAFFLHLLPYQQDLRFHGEKRELNPGKWGEKIQLYWISVWCKQEHLGPEGNAVPINWLWFDKNNGWDVLRQHILRIERFNLTKRNKSRKLLTFDQHFETSQWTLSHFP
jgi:hypothetical protein